MAYIGKKPEDTFKGLANKDTFTGDGSTVAFDLTLAAPAGGDFDIEVFVENVRQEPGAGKAYTLGADGSGNIKRITFSKAPESAAEIYVINPGKPYEILTIADNSVTTAKILNSAVLKQPLHCFFLAVRKCCSFCEVYCQLENCESHLILTNTVYLR